MNQPFRCPRGGLIDRRSRLSFHFDGRRYDGHPGDTLASALLANGVRLIGRSFKYHRPRGFLTAGTEEPNGLVELGTGPLREPNTRATTIELFDGLEAQSQNRWPSLRFDLQSANGLVAPLLTAGFYYKTFLGSARTWTKLYEPFIRRAAGLGRAPDSADPDIYSTQHAHCDVLVIGGGLSGLMAARTAAEAGARVLLCSEDFAWGGQALSGLTLVDGAPAERWIGETIAALAAAPETRILPRTTVFGWYDGQTFGAVERLSDHLARAAAGRPRQRLWQIVARHVVLATGAHERPLVFAGNDLPGVMLSSAACAYARRWAVRVGERAVILGIGEAVSGTAEILTQAGISVERMVDLRRDIPEMRALGGRRLRGVELAGERIACDLLCIGGGWMPAVHLISQRGVKPVWRDDISAFTAPWTEGEGFTICGRAAGLFDSEQRLESGAAAGRRALQQLGQSGISGSLPRLPTAALVSSAPPYRLPGRGKAFVDFQNDVTTDDVALAAREGYSSVELLKRYTTLGMATDQGKTSNINGLALLGEATARPMGEIGTTVYRPPYTPVALGALAGEFVGARWRPIRHTPFHHWTKRRGASFTESGLWMRSQCFPHAGEGIPEAANREVLAVRSAVGVCDISTLGKIVLEGPDALSYLNRVYANRFDTLEVGRIRYAMLLREDGVVLDDGTVIRLAEDRYFLTVPTAGAAHAFEHLTYCAETIWAELDIQLADVTEDFAGLMIAGPTARTLISRLFDNQDLSNEAFPYLSAREISTRDGLPALLLRVSFSGELGYELYAPSGQAEALMEAVLTAGADLGLTPYGVEALGILRIEKGFVSSSEIEGTATCAQLNLGRLVASAKQDFIGKALADRVGLTDPNHRPQIVGLQAVDPNQPILAGAHMFEPAVQRSAANDLGYVTTATWSPSLRRHIALAFLVGGQTRIGQRLAACSPVHGTETPVEVCHSAFIDPEGERVRA